MVARGASQAGRTAGRPGEAGTGQRVGPGGKAAVEGGVAEVRPGRPDRADAVALRHGACAEPVPLGEDEPRPVGAYAAGPELVERPIVGTIGVLGLDEAVEVAGRRVGVGVGFGFGGHAGTLPPGSVVRWGCGTRGGGTGDAETGRTGSEDRRAA